MNFFFWIRALAIVALRFILLLAIGLFSEGFEVSPLPAWTLTAFVYLLLFLATYGCARIVFGKILPTQRTLFVTLFFFLIIQTIAEAILYVSLTNAPLRNVIRGYSFASIALLAWHAVAIILAYQQKRRSILRSVVPEGLQF